MYLVNNVLILHVKISKHVYVLFAFVVNLFHKYMFIIEIVIVCYENKFLIPYLLLLSYLFVFKTPVFDYLLLGNNMFVIVCFT